MEQYGGKMGGYSSEKIHLNKSKSQRETGGYNPHENLYFEALGEECTLSTAQSTETESQQIWIDAKGR